MDQGPRKRPASPHIPALESFAAVAEQWLKRHVEKKKLRSKGALKRILEKHILPAWAGRDFASIKRKDVANLLDKIEDESGPVAADAVLHTIGGIANWYATRDDNYTSPLVKGMRRSNPRERARTRTLSEDEIRSIWRQAEVNGTFGAFVRLSILTAQRLDKVASMRWDEVSVDGTWTIPTEDREKGNAGKLPLPEIAIEIIRAQPHFAGNPYVLASGRGMGHFSGFSKAKRAFDDKLSAAGVKMEPWVIHDLRRTARSLMSRAGVRPDIAERVLGHTIKGVRGVYDRHEYRAEKADALRKLAGLIDTIVNPPVGNVVSFWWCAMSKHPRITDAYLRAIFKAGLDFDEIFTQAKQGELDLFSWLERRWYVDRDLVGLYATVWVCFFRHEPLPDWASLGVIETIAKASQQCGNGLHQREERHRRRWAKVEELKKLPKEEFKRQFGEKKNLPNVWRIAAEQLTAEGEPTTDEAVRKSCQEVARLFKAMNRYCSRR